MTKFFSIVHIVKTLIKILFNLEECTTGKPRCCIHFIYFSLKDLVSQVDLKENNQKFMTITKYLVWYLRSCLSIKDYKTRYLRKFLNNSECGLDLSVNTTLPPHVA